MLQYLSPAVIVAASPLFIFLLDRIVEQFPLLNAKHIAESMQKDTGLEVRRIGDNSVLLNAVRTFFHYVDSVHRIIQLCLASLLSLLISQYACTNSIFHATFTHLTIIIIIVGLLFMFIRKLIRQEFISAEFDSARWFRRMAISITLLVIVVEVARGLRPQYVCLAP